MLIAIIAKIHCCAALHKLLSIKYLQFQPLWDAEPEVKIYTIA